MWRRRATRAATLPERIVPLPPRQEEASAAVSPLFLLLLHQASHPSIFYC